jgi:hypothetical protein
MDPNATNLADITPSSRLGRATRADMNALDLLGWVLNPAVVNLNIGQVAPTPLTPVADASVRVKCPLFTWEDTQTNSETYSINIFEVDPSVAEDVPDPLSFSKIEGMSFCLPSGVVLAPGEYWWELVGMGPISIAGYSAGYQKFTVLCPADFAGPGQSPVPDGQLTADDIITFLNLFFAGNLEADVAGPGQSTTPDGAFTADDIIKFLNNFFAGC